MAIEAEALLDLAAPATLNMLCFRYSPGDDVMQAALAADLEEADEVVLSTTVLHRRSVLCAAIVNHRTSEDDVVRPWMRFSRRVAGGSERQAAYLLRSILRCSGSEIGDECLPL